MSVGLHAKLWILYEFGTKGFRGLFLRHSRYFIVHTARNFNDFIFRHSRNKCSVFGIVLNKQSEIKTPKILNTTLNANNST